MPGWKIHLICHQTRVVQHPLMTPSLPLHGVASALFRRKYVPGAGLRPELRYWSLRQAGAYLGPGRGESEAAVKESVALLVPTQETGQRSREFSSRKRGTRRDKKEGARICRQPA